MVKKSTSSTTLAILGAGSKKPATRTTKICVICDKPIPANRLEALVLMNTPVSKYTHTKCSTVTKIKGIYLGEVGTSEIMLCDKLYNDSVRSVFRRADAIDEDEDEAKHED